MTARVERWCSHRTRTFQKEEKQLSCATATLEDNHQHYELMLMLTVRKH